MRPTIFFLLGVTMLVSAGSHEKITVLRQGRDFLVRSSFSERQDIIIRSVRGGGNEHPNEAAWLVPQGSSLADYEQGEKIHAGADELPAFFTGDHGILGGNHASSFARQITAPGHGLTESALGTVLTSGAGKTFVIMKIIDASAFMVHPVGAKPGYPAFASLGPGDALFWPDRRQLQYEKITPTQLWPGTRITADAILVDGQAPLLDDGREVECDFLEHRFAYDVVMPEALVDLARQNPRQACDFRDPRLDILFSVETVFRFQPAGACTMDQTYRIRHSFSSLRCLGVMFMWSGTIAQQPRREFYIPKLKPFTTPPFGPEKVTYDCDFAAIYDLPAAMPVSFYITREQCLDPNDLPDRFVRISGDHQRRLGFALGYSLFQGCTAKANQGAERDAVYFLYSSQKMYPFGLQLNAPAAGTERRLLAFRQYFNPQREPDATSFLHHRQADADVVYLDFHKNLSDKTIVLPQHLAGRPFTILEKTPSLTLKSPDVISPAATILLSVTGNYGYVVLKID